MVLRGLFKEVVFATETNAVKFRPTVFITVSIASGVNNSLVLFSTACSLANESVIQEIIDKVKQKRKEMTQSITNIMKCAYIQHASEPYVQNIDDILINAIMQLDQMPQEGKPIIFYITDCVFSSFDPLFANETVLQNLSRKDITFNTIYIEQHSSTDYAFTLIPEPEKFRNLSTITNGTFYTIESLQRAINTPYQENSLSNNTPFLTTNENEDKQLITPENSKNDKANDLLKNGQTNTRNTTDDQIANNGEEKNEQWRSNEKISVFSEHSEINERNQQQNNLFSLSPINSQTISLSETNNSAQSLPLGSQTILSNETNSAQSLSLYSQTISLNRTNNFIHCNAFQGATLFFISDAITSEITCQPFIDRFKQNIPLNKIELMHNTLQSTKIEDTKCIVEKVSEDGSSLPYISFFSFLRFFAENGFHLTSSLINSSGLVTSVIKAIQQNVFISYTITAVRANTDANLMVSYKSFFYAPRVYLDAIRNSVHDFIESDEFGSFRHDSDKDIFAGKVVFTQMPTANGMYRRVTSCVQMSFMVVNILNLFCCAEVFKGAPDYLSSNFPLPVIFCESSFPVFLNQTNKNLINITPELITKRIASVFTMHEGNYFTVPCVLCDSGLERPLVFFEQVTEYYGIVTFFSFSMNSPKRNEYFTALLTAIFKDQSAHLKLSASTSCKNYLSSLFISYPHDNNGTFPFVRSQLPFQSELFSMMMMKRWVVPVESEETIIKLEQALYQQRLNEDFIILSTRVYLFYRDYTFSSSNPDHTYSCMFQYCVYRTAPHFLVTEVWMQHCPGTISIGDRECGCEEAFEYLTKRIHDIDYAIICTESTFAKLFAAVPADEREAPQISLKTEFDFIQADSLKPFFAQNKRRLANLDVCTDAKEQVFTLGSRKAVLLPSPFSLFTLMSSCAASNVAAFVFKKLTRPRESPNTPAFEQISRALHLALADELNALCHLECPAFLQQNLPDEYKNGNFFVRVLNDEFITLFYLHPWDAFEDRFKVSIYHISRSTVCRENVVFDELVGRRPDQAQESQTPRGRPSCDGARAPGTPRKTVLGKASAANQQNDGHTHPPDAPSSPTMTPLGLSTFLPPEPVTNKWDRKECSATNAYNTTGSIFRVMDAAYHYFFVRAVYTLLADTTSCGKADFLQSVYWCVPHFDVFPAMNTEGVLNGLTKLYERVPGTDAGYYFNGRRMEELANKRHVPLRDRYGLYNHYLFTFVNLTQEKTVSLLYFSSLPGISECIKENPTHFNDESTKQVQNPFNFDKTTKSFLLQFQKVSSSDTKDWSIKNGNNYNNNTNIILVFILFYFYFLFLFFFILILILISISIFFSFYIFLLLFL